MSRAVSCGIWVTKGTRDEAPDEAGLAHFIEHMVFKRTKNRNAYEISRDMEAVGGELNAFTSREHTSFVTHSLQEHLGLSLDVLSDLVARPVFDNEDIKKEKQVVIQEIHMADEQLEDAIYDRYFRNTLGKDPLALPILGTQKTISSMKRSQVVDFHKRHYSSSNLVVSVAGQVDHSEVVDLVKEHLKGVTRSKPTAAKEKKVPELLPFREVIRKPSEQAHVLIGFPAADYTSELRFEGSIVNTALGGGMTSRLYQSVREDRGLAYTVYSSVVAFDDVGMNLIYAGTEPKKSPEVVELILKELRQMKKKGFTAAELEFFKRQVKGQVLLGADDIENRMHSLAVNDMIFGKYRSVDDVIADIDKITRDTVHEYIEQYFDFDKMGILVMGAVPEKPVKAWLDGLKITGGK